MKYFIWVSITLLFTLSLNANNNEDDDIIIPEYFNKQKNKNSDFIKEETVISRSISSSQPKESISVISNDIIIPESFKKHKETSTTNPTDPILTEPIIQSSSSQTITIDTDTDIPNENYEGYYNLIKGSTHLGGSYQQLDYGFLVIEKLDENDFGFYYVIQKGNSAPTDRYGIFHYKEGKFFQKFLDGSPLRDNVKVLKSGMELSTMISGNLGEYNLRWQEAFAEDINTLSPKLQTYLKDSKESYRQIYKENFSN